MSRFFSSLHDMHLFSLSPSITCPHCGLDNQFVSHGFVYHKQPRALPAPVGKRLYCSLRFGRSGCGRTVRLYLDQAIPRLHYPASVLCAFLLLLMAGTSVMSAYQQVTGRSEARHAWRWLQRLSEQLPHWRARFLTLPSCSSASSAFATRSPRLRSLLSTASLWSSGASTNVVADLQHRWQTAFC